MLAAFRGVVKPAVPRRYVRRDEAGDAALSALGLVVSVFFFFWGGGGWEGGGGG